MGGDRPVGCEFAIALLTFKLFPLNHQHLPNEARWPGNLEREAGPFYVRSNSLLP